MQKLNGFLWSIPAIAVYFYSATVLTEYGYLSHFNIPASFISPSLSDNIVYFFQLFNVFKYEIGLMSWWVWFVIGLIILFVVALWFSHSFWRVIIGIGGTLVFLLVLSGFFSFGNKLAANNISYLVPSSECAPIGQYSRYVIVDFYNDEAVVVPIDQNNKMLGGFLLKKADSFSCRLETKEIGKIL